MDSGNGSWSWCGVGQVVREGTPCHLYFDLEYVPEHNPAFDGPAAVITLVDLVREGLRCATPYHPNQSNACTAGTDLYTPSAATHLS